MIKNMYRKLLYGYKSSSKSYKNYLRKKGISIGENVTFYEPCTNFIDTQKPFLVKIGNNVEITRNVIILTHDYSWAVLKQKYNTIIGARACVNIGNNVFIGMNSIILKGVTIGNNVIIGANSVVNKDIPNNCVACGNPVKIICSLEEYYNKRKKLYEDEAIDMFIEYYKQYEQVPPKELFDEFFWIFEKREGNLNKTYKEKLQLTGNFEKTYSHFRETSPRYCGYEEFSNNCIEKYNKKYGRR